MSLQNWIIIYIADIVFWIWILYLGGADMFGDTAFSGIFTFIFTLKWRELSSEGIKLFGWLILFLHTIFFIIGVKTPLFRAFFNII